MPHSPTIKTSSFNAVESTLSSTYEIERKWLVEKQPADLSLGMEISQGYMAIEADGTEVRLRKKGDTYFQTIKSAGNLVRHEIEIELDKDQFRALWPATSGKRVEKTRYIISLGTHTAELDVYKGLLSGLIVVEVEFSSENAAAAFTPPRWFSKEVTEIEAFKNKNLAVYGLPTTAA